MPSNYPDEFDVFNVTSLPEETPLSEAGPGGTRNHPEFLQDAGDAIEKIEVGASYRDHDHSGDDGDIRRGGKLDQANTHEDADTDDADAAIHHTIGPSQYQVARGNHNHDYNGLLNIPWQVCTSSTRPASPTVGMMIYETDTRRFRQWSIFPNNTAVTGLFSIDYFARTSVLDPGSDWEASYDLNENTHGRAATPDGNTLSWIDGGTDTNRGIFRRTNVADKETLGDDQVLTWKTGTTVIEWELPLFSDGALNDGYLRMSADKSSYIRIKVGFNYLKVFYTTTGKDNERHLGTLDNISTDIAEQEWRAQIVDRTITIFRNGEQLGQIIDTKAVTAKGAANRGWGIGMVAGTWAHLGQATPANVDWVSIADYIRYTTLNRWTILPIAGQPTCRLRQSRTQKLTASGSILEWGEELEDNFDYFDVRSPTSILVREPGLYRVEATLQWNPQTVPDVAHIIAMVNGVDTTVRDSKFMRGNTLFQPGFSQTLAFSAPLRFAENDVLQIKAKYTVSNSLLDLIFSYFDAPSKVNSRLDLTYLGP